MSWNWYAVEQEVHHRRAADLRWAERNRLANAAHAAARAAGAGRPRRPAARLGAWLSTRISWVTSVLLVRSSP
jgi:hypothetical protein